MTSDPRNLVYSIFVDRFAADGGLPLAPFDPTRTPRDHHAGGTLDGIAARLDHVASMGADALYLTPVTEAASNHKYDARDLFHADARFGGDAAFRRLADDCSRRGMGLVVDAVLNHVGRDHPWFRAASADAGAPEARWFRWQEHPSRHDCWRGHGALPELHVADPDLLRELVTGPDSVIRTWLRRGATGWRIDCANDLGPAVCARITATAREENAPDGVTGEVMAYAEPWVDGGALDGVMNYYFRETVLSLLEGAIPAAQAVANLDLMADRYPAPALARSWNVLSSHDTPRLATLVADWPRRAMAWAMAYCYPGIPMVYYGEETGMAGGADPANRGAMEWNEAAWDGQTLEWLKLLGRLRIEFRALREGRYLPVPLPGFPSLVAFARITDNPAEALVFVANALAAPVSARVFLPLPFLPDGVPLQDLLAGGKVRRVVSGRADLDFAPWQVSLLAPRDDMTPNYRFFKGWEPEES